MLAFHMGYFAPIFTQSHLPQLVAGTELLDFIPFLIPHRKNTFAGRDELRYFPSQVEKSGF